MIEVYPNLYVGNEDDEAKVRFEQGWFIIHACKEPYHREELGYAGRGAPVDHPEYLMAYRDCRLILNLVDVFEVEYIRREIVDAALAAIRDNIGAMRVLIHCNRGQSRSPTLALLYLLQSTDVFDDCENIAEVCAAFRGIYPPYFPARGMADYVRRYWALHLDDIEGTALANT